MNLLYFIFKQQESMRNSFIDQIDSYNPRIILFLDKIITKLQLQINFIAKLMQAERVYQEQHRASERISLQPINLNRPSFQIQLKSSPYDACQKQALPINFKEKKIQFQNMVSPQTRKMDSHSKFLQRKKGRLTLKEKRLNLRCNTSSKIDQFPVNSKRFDNRERCLVSQNCNFEKTSFSAVKNPNTQGDLSRTAYLDNNRKYNTSINEIPFLWLDQEDDLSEYEGKTAIEDEMDNIFDLVLQRSEHCRSDMMKELLMKQSITKRKDKDDQNQIIQEPNEIFPIQTHQELLEEQNTYIREQLLQFMEMIEKNRKLCEEKGLKNDLLARENSRLAKQVQRITLVKQSFEEELIANEEQYYSMSAQTSQYTATIGELKTTKQHLRIQVERLSNQYQQLFETFAQFQLVKEKQIQQIVLERHSQKQAFVDQLSEKELCINELSDYINTLKDRLALLDEQNQLSKNQGVQESEDMIGDIFDGFVDVNEPGNQLSKSLCLSLTQAEKLKGIIEQKQKLHQKETSALKAQLSKQASDHTERMEQYEKRISQLSNKEVQFKYMLENAERVLENEKCLLEDSEQFQQQYYDEQGNDQKQGFHVQNCITENSYEETEQQNVGVKPVYLLYQSIDELYDEQCEDLQESM